MVLPKIVRFWFKKKNLYQKEKLRFSIPMHNRKRCVAFITVRQNASSKVELLDGHAGLAEHALFIDSVCCYNSVSFLKIM